MPRNPGGVPYEFLAMTPEEYNDKLTDMQKDQLWFNVVTHGRGIDTISVSEKRVINDRMRKHGTGVPFPEVEDTCVSLADNLTIGIASND